MQTFFLRTHLRYKHALMKLLVTATARDYGETVCGVGYSYHNFTFVVNFTVRQLQVESSLVPHV